MLKRFLVLITLMVIAGCSRNKTVWDGIYTEAQAVRGRDIYNSYCIGCHTADLKLLTGAHFIDNWREESLQYLFDKIKTTMPGEAPASLSNQQYVDVLTFILKKNGFPEGRKDLNPENLGRVRLVGRDGPRPLPDGAIVEAVGCLTQVTEASWNLTKSTPLARSRMRFDLTPNEMKTFHEQRPGRESVALKPNRVIPLRFQNLNFSSLLNHKVVAEGRLVRNTSDVYIEIRRVLEVDQNCAR